MLPKSAISVRGSFRKTRETGNFNLLTLSLSGHWGFGAKISNFFFQGDYPFVQGATVPLPHCSAPLFSYRASPGITTLSVNNATFLIIGYKNLFYFILPVKNMPGILV